VSVRGEDGRSVKAVDISPFISTLPGGKKTDDFSTDDASGSTSMAAGVVEALEVGARCLLFDEDSCATNFLIRE
jgi:predicted ABC-class ATPase